MFRHLIAIPVLCLECCSNGACVCLLATISRLEGLSDRLARVAESLK